ncbi:NAD(P)-binding protein [Hyaloscypha variabilis F]|jgi:NADPH2:quinone reductase|uniref:NAD(P)-binding protein n=1 Tax=Hyaloscypha variabilis (strain UAMH 11265 / GT02V1 / F) TaxID=1149755 RepID=A0A2J6RRB6_HYAVF|nr:NAD(P)-binding protein [Hyaloscypha variabilis F]
MQQAVFVTDIGKPLTLGTRAIPEPKEGEVQIKVLSTLLAPHDTYGLDLGLFIGERLPFILGTNIAGTITSAPPTSPFNNGDLVFGLGDPLHPTPDMSGLQQYALLNAESSAKIPEGFTPDEMVTFPVNATTSFAALFDMKGFGFPAPLPFPQPTESKELQGFNAKKTTILVIGGGSAVGKLAIQLAKLAGIGNIITIASSSRTEELKQLGASHIVDRHATPEAIQAEIREIVRGEGLRYIYDCVSWDHEFSISLLAEKGEGVLLTLHPAEKAQEVAKKLRPEARVQFILGTAAFIQPHAKAFWDALPTWVKEGNLNVGKVRVVEGLDLKAIEEALAGFRDGSAVVPGAVHPNCA